MPVCVSGGPMRVGSSVACAVAALLTLSPAALSAQTVTAVVHGEVIDGNGGTPIRDGVVLIRGNRIVAVGPFGTVNIPPDARLVDAAGKSVLPGLADMHV